MYLHWEKGGLHSEPCMCTLAALNGSIDLDEAAVARTCPGGVACARPAALRGRSLLQFSGGVDPGAGEVAAGCAVQSLHGLCGEALLGLAVMVPWMWPADS